MRKVVMIKREDGYHHVPLTDELTQIELKASRKGIHNFKKLEAVTENFLMFHRSINKIRESIEDKEVELSGFDYQEYIHFFYLCVEAVKPKIKSFAGKEVMCKFEKDLSTVYDDNDDYFIAYLVRTACNHYKNPVVEIFGINGYVIDLTLLINWSHLSNVKKQRLMKIMERRNKVYLDANKLFLNAYQEVSQVYNELILVIHSKGLLDEYIDDYNFLVVEYTHIANEDKDIQPRFFISNSSTKKLIIENYEFYNFIILMSILEYTFNDDI